MDFPSKRERRRGELSRFQRRLQFVDFWVVGRKERDFPSRFSLSPGGKWALHAGILNDFFVSNVKSRNETKRSSSHAPPNQPSKRHLMDQKRIGRVPYATYFETILFSFSTLISQKTTLSLLCIVYIIAKNQFTSLIVLWGMSGSQFLSHLRLFEQREWMEEEPQPDSIHFRGSLNEAAFRSLNLSKEERDRIESLIRETDERKELEYNYKAKQ